MGQRTEYNSQIKIKFLMKMKFIYKPWVEMLRNMISMMKMNNKNLFKKNGVLVRKDSPVTLL
jgi:hypothetical protein